MVATEPLIQRAVILARVQLELPVWAALPRPGREPGRPECPGDITRLHVHPAQRREPEIVLELAANRVETPPESPRPIAIFRKAARRELVASAGHAQVVRHRLRDDAIERQVPEAEIGIDTRHPVVPGTCIVLVEQHRADV
jgi:hypothetical protein